MKPLAIERMGGGERSMNEGGQYPDGKTAEKLWHETGATSKQRAFIVNMSQGNIWSFLGCVKLGNFNKTVLVFSGQFCFCHFMP